nr:protein ENHANCED DISEASE RESISTANCE 2-like isoform X5 [Ipomoea batatas]GMD82826.1 protein ENHANCED DISEASE RESISTANCE 2-like isoform X5 [Ipomoea batatas]
MRQKKEKLLVLLLQRPRNGWKPLIMQGNRWRLNFQVVMLQCIS